MYLSALIPIIMPAISAATPKIYNILLIKSLETGSFLPRKLEILSAENDFLSSSSESPHATQKSELDVFLAPQCLQNTIPFSL